MSLPTYKIKKIKATDNNTYEIIPERLQGTDNKYSFSVGQSLKSNSTRIYFDRNYENNLISLLQGLTYSSSNPLNIPICNLMTITNPNYGSASYYLLAVDLTSQNLGYCLATFDDYSAGSQYHLTVRYATVAGSGYGMTWTQGYNNLDSSAGFYFVGEDLATCTVASLSSGSSWNGSIIYSDEGTSSGSGNKYEAKLPPLSHDSVIALQDDIKNSTITLTQGGVTKGSFTLNQNSDTTIDLDAGGADDYNELENIPIVNLSGDSSDDGGEPFVAGQDLTFGPGGDRIYVTNNESQLVDFMENYPAYSGTADQFAQLIKYGSDTGLYLRYHNNVYALLLGMDTIYPIYATGTDTIDMGPDPDITYNAGYNLDLLDSNYSIAWVPETSPEYPSTPTTISGAVQRLDDYSSSWNGTIIAQSSLVETYEEGVYYKMPDENGLTPIVVGDSYEIGDKLYFDTSKEANFLAYMQSTCLNEGDSYYPFTMSGDSALVFGHAPNDLYYAIVMERSTNTVVYSNKAFSESGITAEAGWNNLDSDGGFALTEQHTISNIRDDSQNGILYGNLTQSSGAIYRCVNGSLKKVLNEGDVESITISSTGVTDGTNTYNASDKLDKNNPTGTGALSLNRKADTTVGSNSVAIGLNGTASAGCSYAEGQLTSATAWAAHAEGYGSSATKSYAHAEGTSTTASGETSHAEGSYTTASGYAAHAEGSNSAASGNLSHAEGSHTTAQRKSQHVFGEYNILDTGGTGISTRGTYVEIVGNGTADNARSNARTLDWNGNEVLAGGLTIGSNATLSDGTNSVAISDIAKTSDLDGYVPTTRTINSKALSSNITLAASDVNALPSYSKSISTSAGNPREVRFVRVNYSTFDGNNAAYFKIGAMCSHGNGSSYTFLEDIIIGVSASPAVTCQVYKQVQNTSTFVVDNRTVYFGDVYWVVDTANQCVDFYIIGGQYATLMFTPFTKIGNTVGDTSKIIQYTGSATLYSSGTRVWASGNAALYARINDSTQTGSFYATNVYASSDQRLKENIKDVELDCGKVIDQLNIKEFNFKTDENKKVVVGAIAQDLQSILPDKYRANLINGSKDTYYSINEGKLLYITIQALKEEREKVKNLEDRISRLEKILLED